jgi:pyruvate/2-oxoglutarate/acetoin dehydrogenase E1 component
MPTVLDAINGALHDALAADDDVLLLGEDVLDPYGGAFKATRGLSTAFADRVVTTPISEAGIVGVATGMALRGLRPVVEIMFGDFTTLIVDQLVNHASKMRSMYGASVEVPLVVRTPMGGRRGYGPTHSQSIEKLFLGTPGLRVVAPTALGDVRALLRSTILDTDDPVLFVENKLLYLVAVHEDDDDLVRESCGGPTPTTVVRVRDAGTAALTLTAHGHMAELAAQAVVQLAYEHEVFAELVVPTQLWPLDVHPIAESVRRTGTLVTGEEGTIGAGWGSEVVAAVVEAVGPAMRCARRVAAREMPVPAAPALEAVALPSVDDLVAASLDAIGRR